MRTPAPTATAKSRRAFKVHQYPFLGTGVIRSGTNLSTRSFPRRRESSTRKTSYQRFTGWNPSFAGMTVLGSHGVWQTTPIPVFRPSRNRKRFFSGGLEITCRHRFAVPLPAEFADSPHSRGRRNASYGDGWLHESFVSFRAGEWWVCWMDRALLSYRSSLPSPVAAGGRH